MQKSVSNWVGRAGSRSPTASKSSRRKPSDAPPATRQNGSNGRVASRSICDAGRSAATQSELSPRRSKRAATKSWSSSALPIAASQPGATVSSASQNSSDRPSDARMAMLVALAWPRFAEASTSRIATSGWRAACPAKIAREASVEPLSAKTISQSRSQRCATRLSRVSARVAAPL